MIERLPSRFILHLLVLLLAAGCRQKTATLFTPITATESGIDFSNTIREDDSSHSFINEFGYMGGGVGIGDFNNDGLKDLFFTGNQVSCRLYINKGNNHFDDITKQAGLTTDVWATGVSIADVNHDGYDDIYVCVFGKNLQQRASNLLFINQHDLTFKESAVAYGLADSGYSTQALFLDYDRDGDLDMYLTHYRLNGPNANNLYPRDTSGRSPANDKLYRNEGFSASAGHDLFADVSNSAGIKDDGYGLGVVAGDFNKDGWPDIYVADDFVSNDLLWLNNRKGGFTNSISKAMRHQSYSSMGADAADINNDGRTDIVTLDMLPETNRRKKQTFFFMNYERYQSERSLGYEPSFARNMLQVNNGNVDGMPVFSEVGQLAGIAATDWSWSVLLADFNNDGWKDMHITNGIGRDFINGDFLEFSNNQLAANSDVDAQRKAIRQKLASLEPVKLANYLYMNRQDGTFADVSASAGVDEPSLSNGAAYADLDNDGDLDLITNNINGPAFILINNSRQQDSAHTHFIRCVLVGDSLNPRGIGAMVSFFRQGRSQLVEQNPVRGYFSSVDQDLLAGIGNENAIDSLIVTWPDQRRQVIQNVKANTVVKLLWKNAQLPGNVPPAIFNTVFTRVAAPDGLHYQHHENSFNDFGLQRLLPQKFSQLGPFLATADINGDGLTDLFAGNGIGFAGSFGKQLPNGQFTMSVAGDSSKMEEDMDAVFFDADGDGDQDILVTSGDIQYPDGSPFYRPRLYVNDGKGKFSLAVAAIPESVSCSAGTVRASDFDGDGDQDLFIGGRVASAYPLPPRSYLLQNNKGVFTDVTAKVCPALQQAGMITASVWTDINKDGQPDLVVAGEWMPLRFFINQNGRLAEDTLNNGLHALNGMWRSLVAVDIDDDGDTDLVAGNLGLNCLYNTTAETPMQLFAADIDGNGTVDPVLFYYILDEDGKRRSHPAVGRNQLAEQVPAVKKKFLLYKNYAMAGFDDIFNSKSKAALKNFTCRETRSCWFENTGNGHFVQQVLPMEAQFSPVNSILAEDFDGDGIKDLLLAGNEYQAEVMTGRYDASYGVLLKGDRKGHFSTQPLQTTGLALHGDIKSMVTIKNKVGEQWLVAAANNDSLQCYKINSSIKR